MTKLSANVPQAITKATIDAWIASKGFDPNVINYRFKTQDADPTKLEYLEFVGITLTAPQITAVKTQFPELVNVV